MEVSNWLVSWFISYLGNLEPTFTTYFYRGYDPFTTYHGHPSSLGEVVLTNHLKV